MVEELQPFIAQNLENPKQLTESQIEQLTSAMPSLKERAKTLVELLESAGFIWTQRPIKIEEEASKKLDTNARDILKDLLIKLEAVSSWNLEVLEEGVKSFAEQNELKLGNIAQPLRAALTGKTTSPGIYDVLVILGKEESIARIRDQILN